MINDFRDWLDYVFGRGCNRKHCVDGEIKIFDQMLMYDWVYVGKCPWCEKYNDR